MKIKEMQIGQKAKVVKYTTSDINYRQKLLRMGLIKNAVFELTRIAPLGDPVEIRLQDFNLSLRKDEADALEVEVINE